MRKTLSLVSILSTMAILLFDCHAVAQSNPAPIESKLSKSQTNTCRSLDLPTQACVALLDAATAHSVSPVLNDPATDLQTLSALLRPLILEQTIVQGIKSQAFTNLQTALQALSTNGAVNQSGGAPSAMGSTNLVTKPTTTDFLSLASEAGAFTDTVNGSTATIQANALGLVKYLNGIPVFNHWDALGADTLQHINFNATLGLTQNGSTTASTSGAANGASLSSLASIFVPSNNATLTSFGATYVLYRKFNPQSKAAVKAWEEAVNANATKLNSNTAAIAIALGKLVPGDIDTLAGSSAMLKEAVTKWGADSTVALAIADPNQRFNQLASAYSTYLHAYAKAVMAQTGGLKNATAYLDAVDDFEGEVYTVVNQSRGTPIATAGYTYMPSAQKPATHSFTGSVAYSFSGNPNSTSFVHLNGAQLTGNVTAVIFAKVPAGAAYGRLQDYQASGEFDLPVGKNLSKPVATLSVAGYGQYQYNATVLNISSANLLPGTNIALPANAQSFLGTAGWLEVAQAKLVVNLKQGLSLPVAVKWSNKTDLIQANEVRGQIGISYDFSALRSLIKSIIQP